MCFACSPTPPAVVPEQPQVRLETEKDPDAVVVELDAQATPADVAALQDAVRRSKRLTFESGPSGRRSVRLRFVTTEARERAGHLEVEMTATGFTGESCQIFQLSPKLKKANGRASSTEDVQELRAAGVGSIVSSIEALAPKIGPNATCVATGK
jgi:hypothetical protein